MGLCTAEQGWQLPDAAYRAFAKCIILYEVCAAITVRMARAACFDHGYADGAIELVPDQNAEVQRAGLPSRS